MSFPYDIKNSDGQIGTPTSDLIDPLQMVVSEGQNSNDSFIEKILKVFGFNIGEQSWGAQVDSIFSYIQAIANLALGLLAFISVIILIYNFFMIFFSKEKEGVENAQKAVKRVAYVILIIWCSWIIVSALFWAVSKIVN